MNRIELTNFRVFQETTAFNLSPITILTGKNNSGKSSLIKSFLLLADYFDLGTNQRFLLLNGARASKHKLPDYSKVKNWSPDSPLQTTFNFQIDDYQFQLSFGGEKDSLFPQLRVFTFKSERADDGLRLERTAEGFYLEVSQRFISSFAVSSVTGSVDMEPLAANERIEALITDLRMVREQLKSVRSEKSDTTNKRQLVLLIEREQQLERQQRRVEQSIRELENRPENLSVTYQVNIPFQEEEDYVLSIPSLIRSGLSRYTQEQYRSAKSTFRYSTGDDQQFFQFSDRLRRMLTLSVTHLSPNRTHQARLYYAHDRQSEINDIISEYARLKIPNGSAAGRFLKKWLKEYGLGEEVVVKAVKGEATTIELTQEDRQIDLADMGFGTGQLLTMLLKITTIIHLRRDPISNNGERIMLVEEPESNLHPNLQSLLAEMFLEASSQCDIQFILETHSEYLIREIQALVKEINSGERNLKSAFYRKQRDFLPLDSLVVNPFKIYYFDNQKGPYEMRFREDGKFVDEFGSGFFNESRRLAFKIL